MKENNVIIITAVFNLIVAILKLISGITFSFSTGCNTFYELGKRY